MNVKNIIKELPLVGKFAKRINTILTRVPPGHFYSPIVSAKEIKRREDEIYAAPPRTLKGIELNESSQVSFLEGAFERFGSEHIFNENKESGKRYYYKNNYFGLPDATSLYLMLRHYKPNNIIEVGSGYSSAVILDTLDLYFKERPQMTFIEPYPKRLKSLLEDRDAGIKIIEKNIQEVPLDTFKALNKNDILFIDSTHVSKTGSDVNYLLFDILPVLNPGVIIHIHDIFYPFEYPKEWVIYGNGRFGWNEAYILRAFLLNQNKYEILLYNHFLQTFHKSWFSEKIPAYSDYGQGGSIWLKKCN